MTTYNTLLESIRFITESAAEQYGKSIDEVLKDAFTAQIDALQVDASSRILLNAMVDKNQDELTRLGFWLTFAENINKLKEGELELLSPTVQYMGGLYQGYSVVTYSDEWTLQIKAEKLDKKGKK